jgi:hypothetical protein
MAVRGVLKKDTWAAVHMQGGETFERVRFVGFTNTESLKTHLPYDLNGMVILEDAAGKRYLVRAKAIRMIVIAQATEGGGSTTPAAPSPMAPDPEPGDPADPRRIS